MVRATNPRHSSCNGLVVRIPYTGGGKLVSFSEMRTVEAVLVMACWSGGGSLLSRSTFRQGRPLIQHEDIFSSIPQLEELDLGEIWFEQDGAMAHTSWMSMATLREHFPEHFLVSIRGI